MSSFKSTAIYLPGILIPRAMSLLLIIIMTHFIQKSEYGLFSLVITVGELIDTSLTTWVRLALLRLGSGGSVSAELARVILKTVLVTTVLGCIISLMIAYLLIGNGFLEFWIAVASYTCSISLLRFGLSLLQAKNQSALYSIFEILRAIISFFMAFLAVEIIGPKFVYPSVSINATTLIFALITMFVGLRGLKPSTKSVSLRDVTGFAGPLLILSVLTIVANAMDRLVLQYYWAAAAVGGYAATYALARQPVDVLSNAINTGGYPSLVKHYDKDGRTRAAAFLSEQVGFFFKLIIPVAIVLFFIQNDIIVALLPSEYHGTAGQIFGLILLAAVAYNLRSAIFDNVFHVEQKNYMQLRYFVFVFVIGAVMAVYFVPRMGPAGSALVFVAWTLLALILSLVVGRSLIPIRLSWKDILHTTLLTIASCCGALLMRHFFMDFHPFQRLLGVSAGAGVGYIGMAALLYAGHTRRGLTRVQRWARPK